jgi:hypothetical protein
VQRAEPGESILRPSYIVEPMRIVTGSTVTLPFVATSSGSQQIVVARVKIDGRTVVSQTLGRSAHAGMVMPFQVVLSTSPVNNAQPRHGRLVAEIARDSEVEVDVGLGPTTDQGRADVFERRYMVARTGRQLAVQTPGLQYHRFDFGHVTWVRQNVGDHLAEG